jgi:hypothetical protein
MQVLNGTSYVAERLIVMDRNGMEQLLVLLKATYDLTQFEGRVPRAAEQQEPVRLADEYRGEPGESSILHAAEGALFKTAADVMLQGHAYPRKIGDTQVNVALSVGKTTKSVRVVGDRKWQTGVVDLVPSSPVPFAKIPIVYERTFGGTDPGDDPKQVDRCPANPVGMGFRGRKNPLNFHGMPVPNLEHPSHPIQHPGKAGLPCCLGPIAPNWSPRSELAGTYDDPWMANRMPLLPEDFNPRFHHCVPADQIMPGYLEGGEPVAIVGATQSGNLGFSLPREDFEVTARISGEDRDLRMHCDTLVIDTDRMLLTLLWRASTPIQGRVHEFDWLRIRQ